MSSSCTIQIRVKTLNSDTHEVKLKQSATIVDLKKQVRLETGVEVDRQRLIFQGKVLLNEKDINFYAIKDGMTIHMVESMLSPAASNASGNNAAVDSASNASRNGSSASARSARNSEPSTERRSLHGIFQNLAAEGGGNSRRSGGPPVLRISETPDGYLFGARIDLDDRLPLPPVQSILSNVLGLVRNNADNPSGDAPAGDSNSNRDGSRTVRNIRLRNPRLRVTGRINRRITERRVPSVGGREPLSSTSSDRANRNDTGNSGSVSSSTRSGSGRSRSRQRIYRVPLIHQSMPSSAPPPTSNSMTRNAERLRRFVQRADASFDVFDQQFLRSRVGSRDSAAGTVNTTTPLNMSQLGNNVMHITGVLRDVLSLLDRMAVTLQTHDRRLELSRNNETSSQTAVSSSPDELLRDMEHRHDLEALWSRLDGPIRNTSSVLNLVSELSTAMASQLNSARRENQVQNSNGSSMTDDPSLFLRILGDPIGNALFVNRARPRSARPFVRVHPPGSSRRRNPRRSRTSPASTSRSGSGETGNNAESSGPGSIWDVIRTILGPGPSSPSRPASSTASTRENSFEGGGAEQAAVSNQGRPHEPQVPEVKVENQRSGSKRKRTTRNDTRASSSSSGDRQSTEDASAKKGKKRKSK